MIIIIINLQNVIAIFMYNHKFWTYYAALNKQSKPGILFLFAF